MEHLIGKQIIFDTRHYDALTDHWHSVGETKQGTVIEWNGISLVVRVDTSDMRNTYHIYPEWVIDSPKV